MILPPPRFFQILLYLLAVELFSSSVYGQHAEESASLTRSITSVGVNYLGVAVSHERQFGERTTLFVGGGAHYSFYDTSFPTLGTRFINVIDRNFGRDYSTSGITPYAFLEARVYTNLRKRLTQGKNINHNAGTYVALFGELPFATGNLINVSNLEVGYPVGLKIGLRRGLSDHLVVDGSAALVTVLSSRQRSLGPRLDLALLWVFSK
jgi:hypothetical protein